MGRVESFWRCPEAFETCITRLGQKLVSQVKVATGVGWGPGPLLLRKEGLGRSRCGHMMDIVTFPHDISE